MSRHSPGYHKAPADVNATDSEGKTPTQVINRMISPETPAALIAAGAVLDVKEVRWWWRKAIREDHTPIAAALIERRFHANLPAGTEEPLLLAAVLCGNVAVAKMLLEKGADANAKPRRTKMTPLRAARETGNKALVELLTQYGTRK